VTPSYRKYSDIHTQQNTTPSDRLKEFVQFSVP